MKPSKKETSHTEVCYSKVLLILAALCMCGIFVSCGSEGEESPLDPSVAPLPQDDNPTVEGVSYSGKVVIKFKDGMEVKLDVENPMGPFVNGRTDAPKETYGINRVNEAVRREASFNPPLKKGGAGGFVSRVSNVRRVMTATEEEVTEWRDYWKKQGVETHDWNLVYYLNVPNEEDAKELVKELNPPLEKGGEGGFDGAVEYSEIMPVFYLTNVETPDISNEQGYLKSASQGGLNIEGAWAELDSLFPDIQLRGQHVTVVDQEFDWNFAHEILSIDETAEYFAEPSLITWDTWGAENGKGIANNIHHGTAVVGIIAGQGNSIGKAVKGIAPSSTVRLASMASDGYMGPSADGSLPTATSVVPPGSILTIEVQRSGVTTVASGCTVGDGISSPAITGCVPIEASVSMFNAIKDSTATGDVIIEGAGNGSVDLNDDTQAAPGGTAVFSHYNKVENGTPVNDSGAVMVGASLGANKKKASWSNCGDRVDVFAWGSGVVTSGYGDHPVSTGDINNPDNPTSYTGKFGGTSAATAQIAGIAALIQSYVRQLVEEAGFVGKTVYLDSKQMRQILKSSGQTAVYGQTPDDPNPNCNIGVQPDAVQALSVAENFINNNTLKVVPLNQYVVSGIRYDMDGDKRADLISFSRDKKWFVDLSSVGPNADHFGEWDLVIPSPLGGEGQGEGAMLFPVVHDYNSDGRADLALYDSINGKYYIKYTSSVILSGSEGSSEALVWDRIIDYSADPAWKAYSRPIAQDVNSDRWLDIVLQSPDGYWLVDYGGFDGVQITNNQIQYLDKFGVIDITYKYLSNVDLSTAPGWAWLPGANSDSGSDLPYFKTPDGITNANFVSYNYVNVDGSLATVVRSKQADLAGDNGSYFGSSGGYGDNIGFKKPDGSWLYNSGSFKFGNYVTDTLNFDDILCRPATADYDGDGKNDRAAQCGTSWKLAYSTAPGTFRELDEPPVQVGNDEINAIDPLPAYVYPGGMKYTDQISLFTYYKTKLTCSDGEKCGVSDTIFDVIPPIGPYFAECVKYWAPNASYCWDK